ncbi:MAG: SIS domain-containing protein [Thalassobaculales bacterium]
MKVLEAALAEARAAITPEAVAALAGEVTAARRCFLYGVGRNGLMLQAFAMRLHHLGLEAPFVGQLATPPIGPGDVLVLAAALGSLPSADAMAAAAARAGARVAVITARPEKVPLAHLRINLPARTMDDAGTGALPLGSGFELALHLLCEVVVVHILEQRRLTDADLAARHANLL